MPDEFVALDLETTGLSLEQDQIIEVGATRFDRSGRSKTFQTFVDPGRPIPREVQDLTGIADGDVVGAPRFIDVRDALIEFIGDRAIVGQNIAFDLAFLAAEQITPKAPVYDTWEIASVLLPTAQRLNLGAIAAELGVEMPVAHRALADAEATRDIFLALLTRLDAMPRSLLIELRTFANRAGWGALHLIDEAIRHDGGATIDEAEARAVIAALPVAPPRRAFVSLTPRAEPRAVAADEVEALFAEAARREDLFPGYERRGGQEEMAAAVAENLRDGGHLAVEAGTGTGKSLAYLLPALLHAVRNDDRVVVSTHTLNLQDQLATRDVPTAVALVEAAEARPGALRTTVLKGRSNYLCLERWAQVRLDPSPRTEPEARLFGRIAAWLPETETGDLGELYMTSQERPAWGLVSAESNDCLSRRCSYVRDGSCFLLRARQRAAASHLVIVNHSLLLANAARDDQVLPPFRHLVVDEAHRLEDVATQHYGASIAGRELRDLFDVLATTDRHGQPGFARRLQGLSGAPVEALSPTAGLASLAGSLDIAAQAARDVVRPFTEALRRFAEEQAEDGAGGPRQEISLSAARRAQPAWEEAEAEAVHLDLALQVVGDRLGQVRETLAALNAGDGPMDIEALRGEVNRHGEAVSGARQTLRSTVLRPGRDEITWLTRAEGDVRLSRAPLEVADHLAADLYAGRDSVLVTSATLTAAGSFDFSTRRLGLFEPRTLEVPSPYDYRRAVLTLVAEDLPDPTMPAYDRTLHETVAALAEAASGRTLVLFTSHAAVRATANALREHLAQRDLVLLAQSVDGSPARLLRLLQERPRTVLLGTAAFWEGVDVPGDALSQIIVARLPFPVPTDPIYAGRAEQFDDPFEEYALPQSVLRFRQGFGRLIRHSQDRGVFVVLDSRIVRRSYGETFLEALPDCEVRSLRADDLPAQVAGWLG